jgi:hypothetical protein
LVSSELFSLHRRRVPDGSIWVYYPNRKARSGCSVASCEANGLGGFALSVLLNGVLFEPYFIRALTFFLTSFPRSFIRSFFVIFVKISPRKIVP